MQHVAPVEAQEKRELLAQTGWIFRDPSASMHLSVASGRDSVT